MLTWRFAVHLNRSLVGLLSIVIEKTDVAYLRSFPCVVVKKTFQVTCGDPEIEVGLILSQAGIFGTPKDIPMISQSAPLVDQISVPVSQRIWTPRSGNLQTMQSHSPSGRS